MHYHIGNNISVSAPQPLIKEHRGDLFTHRSEVRPATLGPAPYIQG